MGVMVVNWVALLLHSNSSVRWNWMTCWIEMCAMILIFCPSLIKPKILITNQVVFKGLKNTYRKIVHICNGIIIIDLKPILTCIWRHNQQYHGTAVSGGTQHFQ